MSEPTFDIPDDLSSADVWRQRAEAERERAGALEAENARLREALKPFATVGIPGNWPGGCVLTWDEMVGRGHVFACINYLGIDAQGGPTVDDYRNAGKALATPEPEDRPCAE